jgi:hypothetical protein
MRQCRPADRIMPRTISFYSPTILSFALDLPIPADEDKGYHVTGNVTGIRQVAVDHQLEYHLWGKTNTA